MSIIKSIDNQILLKHCVANKAWAQKELYDIYSGELYALCCRYASDKSEAQDILQEGFIKIFTNLKQYNATGPLIGWMKRIVINTAINYLKKHKAQLAKDIDEYKDIVHEQNIFMGNLDIKDIMKIFIQLPYKYRVILSLFIVEGYTYKEISKFLQLDESSCRSRVHRGKILLQKMLIKENEIAYPSPLG